MIRSRLLTSALLLSTVLSALPVKAGEGPASLSAMEWENVSAAPRHNARALAERALMDDLDDDTYNLEDGTCLTQPFHGSKLRLVVDEPPFSLSDVTDQDIQDYAFDANKENRLAMARGVKQALQGQGVVAKSDDQGSFGALSDWDGVIVPGNVMTASGQLIAHSFLGNKEEADALYAKNRALHDGKLSVIAANVTARIGASVLPIAKSAGTAFVDWIGAPALKAAVAQKVAEGTATYIIDTAGNVVASGIGALAGPAPAAAFYGTVWAFNHGMNYVPLGSTMKELLVGQVLLKPFVTPAWNTTKGVVRKIPSIATRTASAVSSAYTWLKSCFSTGSTLKP